MAKISKRFKKVSEGLDPNKSYTVEEAVKLVKARATAKFDETIELSLNLGVDPKHADQMVRGVVSSAAWVRFWAPAT
jgi:large subunit ribosomal protein L1